MWWWCSDDIVSGVDSVYGSGGLTVKETRSKLAYVCSEGRTACANANVANGGAELLRPLLSSWCSIAQ